MNRVRVAALQYFIRPIETFDHFSQQVTGLVDTAADYSARLLVFPEYFALQLLTLANLRRSLREQIRDLAALESRVVSLMEQLARERNIYIVAGTVPHVSSDGTVRNLCHVIAPSGRRASQAKLHMTPFEEEWLITPGDRLTLFDTDFGRLAVAVCYDVEFPEYVRAAARAGAVVLAVPSCTDDRQGFLRVRYCAQARAIENCMYVVHASTVGSLPMVPAVSLNYGQAAIYTPSDFVFARDGILAEGIPNQETMIVAELDFDALHQARETGTVRPLRDSAGTARLVAETVVVSL